MRICFFFFSSRRRHTRSLRDWSSDVCSSDLGSIGQSRLVPPQKRFGDVPLMSHVRPAFGPTSHVPPRTPSFAVVSPTHFGHGFGFGPVATREIRFTVVAALPVSML